MSNYPMHPAAVAATRAAETSIAENRARLATMAKQAADAARFAPSPTGLKVKPPAPGSNPWLASSWNLSQQALLTNRDPATATRLRAEAGLDGMYAPSREDAARVQASGAFVAKAIAAAVKPLEPETPAPAALAPERDSTSASPETLALVRDALSKIGATVPQREFISLAEQIEGRTRTDAAGRIEVIGSDGQPLIDWRATGESGRIVGYTVEKFLNVVHGIEPDARVKTPPAPVEPEPAALTPFVPLHVRAAQAHAAGPEAIAALLAERYPGARA